MPHTSDGAKKVWKEISTVVTFSAFDPISWIGPHHAFRVIVKLYEYCSDRCARVIGPFNFTNSNLLQVPCVEITVVPIGKCIFVSPWA